jgi:signal peptidase I
VTGASLKNSGSSSVGPGGNPSGNKDTTVALIRDYGGTIVIAVFVALMIRFFLVEAYRIPSAAMRPVLEPGDTIFVAKWPFGLRIPGLNIRFTSPRLPKHGEVVVFSLDDESSRDYIKRIVGVEGDSIEVKDGHLLVNQVPAEIIGSGKSNCAEEKTSEGSTYPVCYEHPALEDIPATKVPAGSVFLLGDFRGGAHHELNTDIPVKSWGIFPITSLRGSALWIWLSVEPHSGSSGGFPNFRFDRMFRRIQ